jgi:hypothetical protein
VTSRVAAPAAAALLCFGASACGSSASAPGGVPPQQPYSPGLYCTTSAKKCVAEAEAEVGRRLSLVPTGVAHLRFVRLTVSRLAITADYDEGPGLLTVTYEPGHPGLRLSNPAQVVVRGVAGQFEAGEGVRKPADLATMTWQTRNATWFITFPAGTSRRQAIRVADALS